MKQGGFTRAVAANDGDQFTRADAQVNLLDGAHRPVVATQSGDFKQTCRARSRRGVRGKGRIRRHN
jgi:hypothetical protein